MPQESFNDNKDLIPNAWFLLPNNHYATIWYSPGLPLAVDSWPWEVNVIMARDSTVIIAQGIATSYQDAFTAISTTVSAWNDSGITLKEQREKNTRHNLPEIQPEHPKIGFRPPPQQHT